MRTLASRMTRFNPAFRGLKIEYLPDENRLLIQLRVAGISRWYIQGDARKLITRLCRAAFIQTSQLELEEVITPPDARSLYQGEGMTLAPKRPRAPQKPEPGRWDEYGWWGDELPPTEHSEAVSPNRET